MISRILVVCVGNVCRSPMAAAMLQAVFPDKQVKSAGINALVNEPAHPLTVRLMSERRFDVRQHRARQLDEALLFGNELLLVMEQQHKTWIEDQWPQTRGRVFRWGHWSDFDVPDPYQREERAFREALALLDRGLSDWKGRL